MRLRDVMTRSVEVIDADASVRHAAEKMRALHVGPLPVLDGHRLVGMLTDRDIVVRAVAEGRDPDRSKVREILTVDVIYGFEDQDIREAAALMEDHKIRRLVVLDHEDRLVGIVSLADIVKQEGRDGPGLAGRVLENVSKRGEDEIKEGRR